MSREIDTQMANLEVFTALIPEAVPAADFSYAAARPLSDLQRSVQGDGSELLKNRFLCRGGSILLTGPTGVGKSSLNMQLVIGWALGKSAFGIQPNGKLRTLIVQAENDDGDLAEMRDGIITGLQLTADEAREAAASVLVIQEDVRTGKEFCDLLDHALGATPVDLVVIDPAFAYLGGDATAQRDVSSFLRNRLNPVLRQRQVGAIVVHHSNKPSTGREKSSWQAGDFAYSGSGSSEWANWARGVINVGSTGGFDVFALRLAKRGKHIGWKNPDGTNRYTTRIAHGRHGGGIFWRELSDEEAIQSGVRARRLPTRADLLKYVPQEGSIAKAALVSYARLAGMGINMAKGFIAELIEAGELFECSKHRRGTRPEVRVALSPQPTEDHP